MCPLWIDKNQGIGRKFKSRCKQWSEIKIGKSRNTTLAWRKIIHITQKDYPPSSCNWFLQFLNLKYKVWWSGFLDFFKLEFYRLQQTEKSSWSNWIFQTRQLQNSSADNVWCIRFRSKHSSNSYSTVFTMKFNASDVR